jgi:hypothetical protein
VAYLNSDVPTFAAYLSPSFVQNEPTPRYDEPLLVEVFAVTSIPRRCLMFSVMTEMGSQHARVPIHYLASSGRVTNPAPLDWLQLWDSYSPYHSVVQHDYLKHSRCTVLMKDKTTMPGKYLFTVDWSLGPDHRTGYAEMAGGHKCAHVIELDNGQLAAQPNNRVVWHDGGAFIGKPLKGHERWLVFQHEFSCEAEGWKWTAGEEELMFYQFDSAHSGGEGVKHGRDTGILPSR